MNDELASRVALALERIADALETKEGEGCSLYDLDSKKAL